MLLFILIIFTVISKSVQNDYPTAHTIYGKLKGSNKQSYGGRTYSSFEGIPYAKPPVGDLRFEVPQDPEPWKGFLETNKRCSCVQCLVEDNVFGTEDCLYIDVFVPRKNPIPNENLDVLVVFHPGGFMGGSQDLMKPGYFMDKDIVMVTLNYRLNVLGFMSTEDDVVPGNMGLKDQVKALQWVQNNIKYFGGNRNSVTLLGHSAGGSSVHLHYFSPLSKGLFHKGISQSGNALAPFAFQVKPLEKAIVIGKALNCSHTSTKDLVNCLKEKSAEDIIKSSTLLFGVDAFPISTFNPVIERPSETAFLLSSPHNLIQIGNFQKLPWISSVTSDEGLLYFLLSTSLEKTIKNWNRDLPYILEYIDSTSSEDLDSVSQAIKEFYFPDGKIIPSRMTKMYGDRIFNLPFEVSSRLHAKYSSAYSIQYGYYCSFKDISSYVTEGVAHLEDMNIMYDGPTFSANERPKKLDASDEKVKDFYMEIVTSFARNGIPQYRDLKWNPVKSRGVFEYLYIDREGNIEVKFEKELSPKTFWWSLPIFNVNRMDFLKDEL